MMSPSLLPIFLRLTALLSIVTLAGCVPDFTDDEASGPVESTAFNQKLRLDGLPLEDAQVRGRLVDLGFGPYRVDAAAVISPLYPVPSITERVDGRTSNLLQSDCLWLATNNNSGRGDQVALNWEEIWTFAQVPGGNPITPDDRRVGLCTYSHPATREFMRVNRSGLVAADAPPSDDDVTVYVASNSGALTESSASVVLPGDQIVSACGINDDRLRCNFNGAKVYGAQLTRFTHSQPDTTANPDGVCPSGVQLRDTETVITAQNDMMSPVPVDGHLPLCMQRGSWRPQRDTNLLLTGQFFGRQSEGIGPDLLVVNRARTVRRIMAIRPFTSASGQPIAEYQWSTPKRSSEAGLSRWQENFSPSIRVARARVALKRNGAPLLRSISAPLCLIARGSICKYSCRATPAADGAIYELSSQYCTNRNNAPIEPTLTPTYDVLDLDVIPGRPQDQPLAWVIKDQTRLGANEQAVLELDLVAVTAGGAALRAAHGALDFGRVEQGSDSVLLETEVENSGDAPIRLDRILIQGSNPQDFIVQLPDRGQPLPLPIDLLPSGAMRFTAALGSDFANWPLLKLNTNGKGYFGFSGRAIGNQQFELYGAPLEQRHGLLLTRNPEFDFVAAARRAAMADQPQRVDPDAWAGGRRLIHMANTQRLLPSVLRPGEKARIAVTANPSALGARSAQLRIEAQSTVTGNTLPPITLLLRAQSVSSARIDALPAIVNFVLTTAGQTQLTRNVLLNNVGELPGTIQTIRVEGADAGVFSLINSPSPPLLLLPGEPELLRVQARPPRCQGVARVYQAELQITLDDGAKLGVPLQAGCAP